MESNRKRQFNQRDEEDMEPFDLDNEYEEGHFDKETGEFYFKSEKQPKRRRMTKEDHLYGDFISVTI